MQRRDTEPAHSCGVIAHRARQASWANRSNAMEIIATMSGLLAMIVDDIAATFVAVE
jgi:hypothetical protein